ncbi:MAG: GTP cyclohydrolase II, partial [Gammaproteobacteria bacterium]|nr:GTP cyclohydrolase II [Gammaproteobacteria bacterium]
VESRIPTASGEFRLYLYTNNRDEKEHLAMVMGEVSGKRDILVRVHSE